MFFSVKTEFFFKFYRAGGRGVADKTGGKMFFRFFARARRDHFLRLAAAQVDNRFSTGFQVTRQFVEFQGGRLADRHRKFA